MVQINQGPNVCKRQGTFCPDCGYRACPLPQPTGRTMTERVRPELLAAIKARVEGKSQGRTMTMSYEEAVREVAKDLRWKSGEPIGDDYFVTVRAGAIRALLAGPPEPTEEEVLGAWFNVEPERLSGPKHRSEIASVQRVQQLYRSRRNG